MMKSTPTLTRIGGFVPMFVLAFMWIGCHQNKSEQANTASQADTAQAVAQPVQSAPSSETMAQSAKPAPLNRTSSGSLGGQPTRAPRSSGDQMASAGREMPGPTERTVALATGTVIKSELLTPLNSKTDQAGDRFSLKVSEPVVVNGVEIITPGAIINGTVNEVNPAGRMSHKASMTLTFDSITLVSGKTLALMAKQSLEGRSEGDTEVQGESKKGRNTALIAGGTAVGAIAGKLFGKDTKSTLIGAAAGGAAGTGAAMAMKGGEVDLKAGSPLSVKLDNPLNVPVRVLAGSNVAIRP